MLSAERRPQYPQARSYIELLKERRRDRVLVLAKAAPTGDISNPRNFRSRRLVGNTRIRHAKVVTAVRAACYPLGALLSGPAFPAGRLTHRKAEDTDCVP